MSSVGELTVSIIGDMSKLSKVFSQASNEVGKFGSSVTNLSTSMSSKLGSALKTVGTVALATGTALGAGLAYETYKSVTAFETFEQSVANAASVVGKTGEAYEQAKANIAAVAQELGQKTVFSSSQAADAMYNLASAGYDVSTMVSSDLVPLLNLASGTQYGLAETTGIVTSTLSQFGLGFDSASRVSDVFAKAIGVSQASMDKLGYSMNYVGPIANSMGISVEKTTAALSVLYNAGLKGEQAGTGLRSVLSDLVNPTDAAATALQSMGINIEDVNPATHELTDIIQLLADKGLNSAQAFEIFGQVGAPAILALTSQAGSLKTLTSELENAGGAAQTMADQQLDTLKGSLEALSGSIENLFINVGQALAPTIRDIAGSLDEMMPSIQNFIVGIVELFISFVGKLGSSVNSLKAIGSTILEVFNNIFESIAGSGSSVASSVADVINGIMSRIAGIVIETAPLIQDAIIGLINGFRNFVGLISPIFEPVKQILYNVKNTVEIFIKSIGPAWENLGYTFDAVKRIILDALSPLAPAFTSVVDTLTNSTTAISLGEKFAKIFNDVTGRIADFTMSLAENGGIKGAIEDAFNIELPSISEIWDGLKSAVESGIDGLSAAWNKLKEWVDSGKTIITSFIDDLSPSWDNLKSSFDSAKKIFEIFEPSFKSLLGVFSGADTNTAVTVGSALAGVINLITGAIAGILEFAADHPTLTKFVAAVAALATGLAGISVVAGIISAGITALGVAIGTALGSIIVTVGGFATAVGAGLALITSPISLVIAAVALLYLAWTKNWFGIRDTATTVWNGLKTAANELVTGLKRVWDQLPAQIDTLKQQFSNAWNSIVNLFNSVRSSLSTAVSNLASTLSSAYNSIISSASSLLNSWTAHWNNFRNIITTAATNINGQLNILYNYIKSIFTNIVSAATSVLSSWTSHWNNFRSVTSTAASNVNSVLSSMYNYVQTQFNNIKSAASAMLSNWKSHWENIKSTTSTAASTMNTVLNNMLSYIKTKFDNIKSAASTMLSNWKTHWDNVKSATSTAASNITSALATMLSNIKSKFDNIKSAASSILSTWKTHWSDFVSATKNASSNVMSALSDMVSKIKGKVSDFKSAGKAIMQGLLDGIEDVIDDIKDAIRDVLRWIDNNLPHSPAKEGPLRRLPNWDAVMVDPLSESISKMKGLSSNVTSALSGIRSPIDSSISSGLSNVSNVSTSNYSYGGDTLVLENVSINNGMDLQVVFSQFEAWTAQKKRARGY